MKFFNKLKNLLTKIQPTQEQTLSTSPHPITDRITAWLSAQDWHYEHRKPSPKTDGRTHHVILSFSDNSSDWTCVFRINEQNQLMAMFGVLTQTVPPSHYAPMLMKIAHTNLNIAFGSIELDPTDGEVRVKMSVDAEFSTLSHKALTCYLQGLSGLTELAWRLLNEIMGEVEPSPIVHDYLEIADETESQSDGGFFIPTNQSQ